MHQQNAEKGMYGGDFKRINQARKDREKRLELLIQ